MTAIKDALVVGGGIGGMAAAIRLRAKGFAVELIERDPEWRVYGAGISITGPTLRAFGELGVLDEVLRDGAFANAIRFCTPLGHTLAVVPLPRVAGDDVPSCGGILRPALHRILSRSTTASGARVRLGLTMTRSEEDRDGVLVWFSDGTTGRYDIVVGADGARSATRTAQFAEAPAVRPTGQGCWRVNATRPAEIEQPTFIVGRPIRLGLMPTSRDSLYMFCLSPTGGTAEKIPEAEFVSRLHEYLDGFGGVVTAIRDGLTVETVVNYRPLEAMIVPKPWHRGRTVLLGDAAHSTTPHLASGAGIAVEDALVLADELVATDDIETAFERYTERRFDRCRLVVENSVRIGQMQIDGAPEEHIQSLMAASAQALAEPL